MDRGDFLSLIWKHNSMLVRTVAALFTAFVLFCSLQLSGFAHDVFVSAELVAALQQLVKSRGKSRGLAETRKNPVEVKPRFGCKRGGHVWLLDPASSTCFRP